MQPGLLRHAEEIRNSSSIEYWSNNCQTSVVKLSGSHLLGIFPEFREYPKLGIYKLTFGQFSEKENLTEVEFCIRRNITWILVFISF